MMLDQGVSSIRNWLLPQNTSNVPGFDPVFYAKNYPDLRHLRGARALLAHYLRHGKGEGRFVNLREAKDHHARSGHVLPEDFDPKLYARLNQDLATLYDEPWQYELHYLRHGQDEGRRFSSPHARRGWRAIFSLYDFLLFSEAWRTPGPLSHAAALELFEREGVARLTPVARGWIFDPLFYRQNYGLELDSAADLYRDWLADGFDNDRAPNERLAIKPYVGENGYPPNFDWRRFARMPDTGAEVYPAKIKALAGLFEKPLGQDAQRCVAGGDASGVYAQIGDYQAARGHREVAAACYELASRDAPTAKVFVRKGDVLHALGRSSEAVAAYRKALTFSGAPVWAVMHTSQLLIENGDAPAAFATLEEGRSAWSGSPAFRKAVKDCVAARFTQITGATRKLLQAGDVAAANAYAETELGVLTGRIASMAPDLPILGEPHVLGQAPARVVMLACLDLPQCTHYRVEQKVEQLATRGITLEVFDFNAPAPFMSALPGAAAAIFYRVPSYPKIVEAILYARGLGITTFYDIDDLVFSSDFPDTFDSYEGQISREEYVGLRHGVALYRHAMTLCDVGLASTRPLADKVRELVRSRTAHVIANALDLDVEGRNVLNERPRPAGNAVSIFYGSGTKAHNRDFNDVVGPALVTLLERHAELSLTIVGYLGLDPVFERFGDRINRLPFVEDREQYEALLSSCDINISVLAPGVLSDCKSEIKWLEAAVLRIPTVVSHTATFAAVLDPPADGLIAHDTQDWVRHLSSLIGSGERRDAIGAAAYRKALRLYSSEAIGETLVAALLLEYGVPSNRAASDRQRSGTASPRARPSLLICNVFFAPQSHGGATRVVEANVDHFIEHYASVFEVSILATDHGAAPGSFSADAYKGIKVFRIGTPVETNMDWRPFNEDNVASFGRVLDLVHPDLVHFHCIQRLTASIVRETLRRNIPYVVTAHDAWWISDHQFLVDQDDALAPVGEGFKTTLPDGVTRAQSIERGRRLGGLLNHARHTLAVSDKFGDIYRDAGITNVRCVANGTGPLPVPLPPCTNPRKLVLGHVGGKSVHKGAALIEVVLRENEFDNLELVMVDGTIDPGGGIRTLWGATDVLLTGHYPQARINELFASFDVLLAPSIWPESFGLVTREASFYGKWVVASDRGAIADAVDDGINGFKIDVSTTAGLRAVLARMNEAPQSYKTMTSRTASRSADDQARELAELYLAIFDEAALKRRRRTADISSG